MFHEDDKLYKPEHPLDLQITGQSGHESISTYLPLQATCKFDVFGESVVLHLVSLYGVGKFMGLTFMT